MREREKGEKSNKGGGERREERGCSGGILVPMSKYRYICKFYYAWGRFQFV